MISKSITSRKEYVTQYARDESNLRQIREIVKHTILEEEPLYDLKEIVAALNSLGEEYTTFLRVKQEETN
jgi:hypothetical protein